MGGSLSRRQALTALTLATAGALSPPLAFHHADNAPVTPSEEREFIPSQSTASNPLRVLTLNLWGLPTSPERIRRLEAFIEAVPDLNLDFLALQEVWMPGDRRRLIDSITRSALPHYRYYQAGLVGSGLLTFSRHPITSSGYYTFRLNGDPRTPDYYALKGAAFIRARTSAGPVDVYNTHLLAQYVDDARDRNFPHRTAQTYELARLINTRSRQVPVIALGDFNVRPRQLGYRVVTGLTDLVDAYAATHEDARSRIDYVFARSASSMTLTPLKADIVLERIPGEDFDYSDHAGVLAELSVSTDHIQRRSRPSDQRVIWSELQQALQEGLNAAREKQSARFVWAGIGAAVTAGSLLFKMNVQRRRWLRTLVETGIGIPAGLAALIWGWRAAWSLPAEIRAFEQLIAEVEANLGP